MRLSPAIRQCTGTRASPRAITFSTARSSTGRLILQTRTPTKSSSLGYSAFDGRALPQPNTIRRSSRDIPSFFVFFLSFPVSQAKEVSDLFAFYLSTYRLSKKESCVEAVFDFLPAGQGACLPSYPRENGVHTGISARFSPRMATCP